MLDRIGLWRKNMRTFLRAKGGNVAMMFGLSLIPITIAAGAGVDLARAMAVKSSMADALDAAGLAIGSTPGISQSTAQALAQQYFNANFKPDSTNDSVPPITVTVSGQSVVISASDNMPTTVLKAAGQFLHSSALQNINVMSSTTVVWGQTKLWVALVLDNTGSMCQPDNNPCPGDNNANIKINALKTATHNLLTTLQNASAVAGDVKVSITPFAKLVNVGTLNPDGTSRLTDTWIDWTDWEAEPVDKNGNADAPGFSDGPGTSCPWTTSSDGFVCVKQPSSSSTTGTIPSSGTYSGYICPGVMQSYNASTGSGGHYFNGCYTSTAATNTSTSTSSNTNNSQVCSKTGSNSQTQCTCSGYPQSNTTTSGNSTTVTDSTCSCKTTGSGSSKKTTCTAVNVANTTTTTTTNGWTHAWVHNNHSTWNGCIEDRAQDYDTTNTTPGSGGTLFPAANDVNCPVASNMGLSYDWTALSTKVDSMVANGSTNQTVGLQHGWQTLTDGAPYSAGTLPASTSQYIILLSDGLNTQNRWAGDGTNQASSVDDRMSAACYNAKQAHITIYTIFVDLNGTQGNSTVLQNCATDLNHYFDLTTTGSIITTFNSIAQKITSLRVSG